MVILMLKSFNNLYYPGDLSVPLECSAQSSPKLALRKEGIVYQATFITLFQLISQWPMLILYILFNIINHPSSADHNRICLKDLF